MNANDIFSEEELRKLFRIIAKVSAYIHAKNKCAKESFKSDIINSSFIRNITDEQIKYLWQMQRQYEFTVLINIITLIRKNYDVEEIKESFVEGIE